MFSPAYQSLSGFFANTESRDSVRPVSAAKEMIVQIRSRYHCSPPNSVSQHVVMLSRQLERRPFCPLAVVCTWLHLDTLPARIGLMYFGCQIL